MRVTPYLAALMTVAVASSASAQTRPFEELEASRRQRIEMDKRMAREAAEQRKKDKEKAAAGVRDAAALKAASQPPLPGEAREGAKTKRPPM